MEDGANVAASFALSACSGPRLRPRESSAVAFAPPRGLARKLTLAVASVTSRSRATHGAAALLGVEECDLIRKGAAGLVITVRSPHIS